jgi:hypothetical protein
LSRWRERAFAFTAYADPAKGGRFTRRFGHPGFRLLIVTTADPQRRRARNIRRTINAAVGNSRIFLATTVDQLANSADPMHLLVAPIWQRPGDDGACSLLRAPAKAPAAAATGPPVATPVTGRPGARSLTAGLSARHGQ